MSHVVEKKGGPFSLFCTDCNCWVPNTANAEMAKEGVFAHSHHCSDGVCDCKNGEIHDTEYRKKAAEVELAQKPAAPKFKSKPFSTKKREYAGVAKVVDFGDRYEILCVCDDEKQALVQAQAYVKACNTVEVNNGRPEKYDPDTVCVAHRDIRTVYGPWEE